MEADKTIASANTVVNNYYPASGSASAGATSLSYGGASTSRGMSTTTALSPGDLLFIIQMQDGAGATNSTSAINYPASTAGNYEFARVLSVSGTTVNLTSALKYTYVNDLSTTVNRTYQIIRVPQYTNLTINAGSSIVPAAWDGNSGGIVVIDVSNSLVNNGSIDASFSGFRGNAGVVLTGQAGAAAQTAAAYDRSQTDAYLAHGGKGEGIGGTPNGSVTLAFSSPGVLITSGTTSANGTATNVATAATYSISALGAIYSISTSGRSYNGYSRARGAPANAGGGGSDAAPVSNSQNTGGGGGGNGGAGGIGGNSWNTNAAVGGLGGSAITPSITGKLIMGGGGGSGSTNNSYGLDSSGGNGGGIIFIKAGSISGSGIWAANGQAGRAIPVRSASICTATTTASCDGAGGGGAAGTIVALALSGSLGSVQLQGGQGGNIAGQTHGPGGGGGGGVLLYSGAMSAPASTLLTGGAAGLTQVGAGGSGVAYGAAAGSDGVVNTVSNTSLPADAGGLISSCLPSLTTTKITSIPAATTALIPPVTTTYTIVVSNASGAADARNLQIYDPSLPGAGSVTVVSAGGPTATLSTSPSVCGLASRTSSLDFTAGTSSGLTANAWTLPGGCSLSYTFAVFVTSTMAVGTYSNSAFSTFQDPTTPTSRTLTTALPADAVTLGYTANTSTASGLTLTGANYNGTTTSNVGEDIKIQPSANLQITKSNGVTTLTAGQTISYTITVSNLGPSSANGAVVKDTPSSGLDCTGAVSCTVVSGASSLCTSVTPTLTASNLLGSGLTLSSFPPNSTMSFVLTCGVTATGN